MVVNFNFISSIAQYIRCCWQCCVSHNNDQEGPLLLGLSTSTHLPPLQYLVAGRTDEVDNRQRKLL